MHLTAIYWCSFHFPVTQIVGPRALHARLHILAGSPSLIRNDTPWTRARRTAQERRAGAGTLHTRFTFYSLAASNCRCRKHLLASSVTTIEMYKQRGEPNVSQRARKASPTPKIASRHSSFVVDSTLHHTASQLPLAKQADGTAAHDTQDTHCHERPPLTVAASHRRRSSPSPLLTVAAPHGVCGASHRWIGRSTFFGSNCSLKSPCPSWPWLPEPKVKMAPLFVRSRVCACATRSSRDVSQK